jgi:hypothetical protein
MALAWPRDASQSYSTNWTRLMPVTSAGFTPTDSRPKVQGASLMRTRARWQTIVAMKLLHSRKRRPAYRAAGIELAGALSIASQMALLCPPGFDEWVRHELVGDAGTAGDRARRPDGRRR